jgi:O-antigen/teichoic acid export membrane protein
VKLLSQHVMVVDQGRRTRIALKALADVASKAVTLAITVAAARRLNADPFGILAFGMATGWLLAVATDGGLSMYLAREVARDRARTHRLVLDVIGLRTGLAFLAATGTALATPYLVPAQWRIQFVVIVLAQLAGGVIETVSHYFRGIERSEIEAAIQTAQRSVMLIWALIVLWFWRRLDYLAVAMLAPALVAMLVSMAIALNLSAAAAAPLAQAGLTVRKYVRHVLPLGAGVLLSALYFRCDVYFIEHWQGFQPVGGYNAVFRLVEGLRLVPAAVMAVMFPVLVQSLDHDRVKRIGGALAAVGVVLALVCGLGASLIVPAIYGDGFAYAAPAFSILSLALPLFFLNYALTHQVIGWDGQAAYLVIAAVALAGNIAANIALVPSQGIAGAAIGTVLTEVIVTAGCVLYLANRRVEPSTSALVAHAERLS